MAEQYKLNLSDDYSETWLVPIINCRSGTQLFTLKIYAFDFLPCSFAVHFAKPFLLSHLGNEGQVYEGLVTCYVNLQEFIGEEATKQKEKRIAFSLTSSTEVSLKTQFSFDIKEQLSKLLSQKQDKTITLAAQRTAVGLSGQGTLWTQEVFCDISFPAQSGKSEERDLVKISFTFFLSYNK